MCHDGLTVPSRNELGQSLPSFLKLPLLGTVIFMRKVANPKDNFIFVSWTQVHMTTQSVEVNTLLSHPITSLGFVIFQFFEDFFNSFVHFMGISNNHLLLFIAQSQVVAEVLSMPFCQGHLECTWLGFHGDKVKRGSDSLSYAAEHSASLPSSSRHTFNYLFNVTA